MRSSNTLVSSIKVIRIDEGLPGILGNKGTLTKYRRDQGNMSLFLGNRGTKLYKLDDEKIVSKFIKRGTTKENLWEHMGTILEGNKGTMTPLGDPQRSKRDYKCHGVVG